MPVDFILFGLTLVGVALFHHKTLQVAASGLAVISIYNLLLHRFRRGPGLGGLLAQCSTSGSASSTSSAC